MCRRPASNAGVAAAIQRSSTHPTEDHMWQVDHAWEVMGETVPELNELIETRVHALNAQLYAAGRAPGRGGGGGDAGEAAKHPESQGHPEARDITGGAGEHPGGRDVQRT